ncbi:MAG: hypothetical protein DSY91_00530, partial [Deltaproteobacteria bacterium]
LIVPKPSDDQGWDAWRQFECDGRWALVSLACYFFLAFLSNPLLFGVSIWLPSNVLEFFMGVSLILVQFTSGRKIWGWATALFIGVSTLAIAWLSPGVYQ